MSSQTTQQALPTGTWSADTIHSTVGFAVTYLAGTFPSAYLVGLPQGEADRLKQYCGGLVAK